MSLFGIIWKFLSEPSEPSKPPPEKAVARTVTCGMCGKPFNTAGRLKANPHEIETYWTETYCSRACGDEKRGGGQALADAMDSWNDADH